MRILIITGVFYPEPIVMSTITMDIAQALSPGHAVTVLTPKPCRPYGYKFPKNIDESSWLFNRIVIESYIHPKSDFIGRFRENLSFGKNASKYIERYHSDFDVIYLNVFPLFAPKTIIHTAKKYGIPIVNHVEDIYPEPLRTKIPLIGNLVYKILLPWDKWVIRHAHTSVVIGNKIREYFIKTRGVMPHKIKVVYNWQDDSPFAVSHAHLDHQDFTFMYAGSISNAANLHNVLKAYAIADIPCSRLIFAGCGTERASLEFEASQLSTNVQFIDAPGGQIAEILSKADVLILPLLPKVALRAVPSKLAAYLFSGKPVLACVDSESDTADIIQAGKCGWVVSPEEIKELTTAMRKIATIPLPQLQKIGAAGKEYGQQHLTRNINLRKLTDIILSAGLNNAAK